MATEPKHNVLGAGLIFLLVIGSLLLGMALKQDRLLRRQSYDHASALHNLLQVTRSWNARHGGVFVKTRPSPSRHASAYEEINPEMMTSELSAVAASEKSFSMRISSLKPVDPANAPDPWERAALARFERGERELAEVSPTDKGLQYRLMRPLYVESSCLPCHGGQGYKIGDVRGGISVSLPFSEVAGAIRKNLMGMAVIAALLIIVFVLTIYFLIWRLMNKLSHMNRQLRDLNETKDRFLGMAAHDLRSPLAGVIGLTEILKDGEKDPAQLAHMGDILEIGEGMLELLNDLLDVSKINSGKLDLELEEADVSRLISAVAETNGFTARRKNISLTLKVDPGVGRARLDPKRCRQLLDNLISNAIKYSRPGGGVVIGARQSPSEVSIWIEDQGVGIAPQELKLLFQEFSKTKSRPTAGETSHGLGLAIARRIAEVHGGSIDVASELGKGSRFTVRLPVGPAAAVSSPERPPAG